MRAGCGSKGGALGTRPGDAWCGSHGARFRRPVPDAGCGPGGVRVGARCGTRGTGPPAAAPIRAPPHAQPLCLTLCARSQSVRFDLPRRPERAGKPRECGGAPEWTWRLGRRPASRLRARCASSAISRRGEARWERGLSWGRRREEGKSPGGGRGTWAFSAHARGEPGLWLPMSAVALGVS